MSKLRALLPGQVIELRRTKRSLLGLRRHPVSGLVVRVHPELIVEPDCTVLVSDWVRRRGRGGPGAALKGLAFRVLARRAAREAHVAAAWAGGLEVAGEAMHSGLGQMAERIHAQWFSDLPSVPVAWGRRPPARRLSHLQFGCYRRSLRCIEVSPRLALPWVAKVFIEHVLHHEYCHHRQALRPLIRREGAHSLRFRAWERAYPGHAEARRWEALALPWLLDGSPPPWYRPDRSTP
jgi:hypothetical protein